MKKKNVFISIIIVCSIIVIIAFLIMLKNSKKKLDYELEVVDEINYMVVNENNKFGVIDKYGNIVVQPYYDEIQIPNPSKPLFICKYDYNSEKKKYNIKVLNDKSEQILYQYVTVEAIELNSGISEIPYEKSVLKYEQDGKIGLIDFQGNTITKPVYDEINSFDYNEGLLLVKKNQKYGIININGVAYVNEKYDKIESDGYYNENSQYKNSGFIVANGSENNYKYGYIDRKGKQILDVKYEQIARLENSNTNDIYLVAFENGKAGLYKNNKIVLKHEYEDIGIDKNNNCLIIQQNSKQGLSDFNGKIQIELKYDNIYISGKYVNAQNGDNIDIYDYKTMNKISYENIVGINQTSSEKYSIAITKNDKFKILENENNKLKNEEYEYLEYLYDDYFVIFENGKFGVIDNENNEIIDCKYDVIQRIGKTKIIEANNLNTQNTDFIIGKKVIMTMQNPTVQINENYIYVYSSNDMKYINFDGNIVKNNEMFSSKLYAIKQQNKWGFADENGNIVVECQYDFVTEFNKNGFAGIKKNEKWGVINSDGKVVIEPVYNIDSNKPNFVGKYYELNKEYGSSYFVCDI